MLWVVGPTMSKHPRVFALLLSIPTVVHTRHKDVSNKTLMEEDYWVCDSGECV